jgi:type IV secretory pathway TraG/TraD family ATPase VirD4
MVSQQDAAEQGTAARPTGDPGLAWGGITLPSAADELFFLIAGSIGSGKTKLLTALLRSVVASVRPDSDRRLLVFDPKNELYSVLHGMAPTCPVVSLNPADLRSASWDIGRDVTDPATALQVATALVPADKVEANPFFTTSVRNLYAATLMYLLRVAPGNFTLRDAVLIVESEHYFRQVVYGIPENHHLRRMFEPAITWQSIETTVTAKTAELRILAAFWHHARQSVSLADWVADQSSTLVLGTDPRIDTTVTALNRLLVKRLSDLILAGPDGTAKRTYLVIDELPALGGDLPVPGFAELCHRGRSRGARVVAVFQTVEDLRRILTDHGAAALLNEFANKVLLRAEDPAHARWQSDLFGETEDWEEERSVTDPGGPDERETVRRVRYKRPLVPAAAFYTIEPATPATGLNGYALSPYVRGAWRFHVPGEWVAKRIARPNPFVPAFVPRPAAHQYPSPFTGADLARLKLRGEPRVIARRA